MNKLIDEDSPFNHPCQNPENTVTLLSSDKAHEIDIEFDVSDSTALLNIINMDSSKRKSFIDLLNSTVSFLKTKSINKVYQNVVLTDWDTRLKEIKGFRFVKKVKPDIRRSLFDEFLIVEMNTSDIVKTISTAMGMDVDSHLDGLEKI